MAGIPQLACISVARQGYQYTPEKLVRSSNAQPTLAYQIRCNKPKLCVAASNAFRSVAQRSNLFADVRAGEGGEGVQISLDLTNDGTVALALITGMLSGLTFTVLPGYARDDYSLTAQVRSGAMVKQYSYENSLSSWIQMFLVFGMFTHSRGKQQKAMYEDMFSHLLSDMQRDGLLAGSLAPSSAAPAAPDPSTPPAPAPPAAAPPAPAPPPLPATPAASGGEKLWYWGRGSEKLGPHSESEMRGFFAGHQIAANTLVWRAGMPGWAYLCNTVELAGLVKWYYNQGGSKVGPVTAAQLRQLVQAGRLVKSTPVWRTGLARWAVLQSLPELGSPP